MKKLFALLLAVLMVFALVACATEKEETQTPAGTETPAGTGAPGADAPPAASDGLTKEQLEASLPCEYVPEKLEAGIPVLIGYSTTTFDNAIAYHTNEYVKEQFLALGCQYNSVACDQDTALQIQQIENFVTMGTACLYIAAGDPDAVKDAILAAEAAGTRCMFYGAMPNYDISGTCNVDLNQMGRECGLMAIAWLDQQYPDAPAGSIDTAVFGYYFVTECGMISDGIKNALATDARVNIVYTHDDCIGIDNGFTAAEQAVTASPDLKLIASYDMDAAIGAANYLTSLPDADLTEYGVFTTNTNSEIDKLLEDSANGIGCFRGTITGSLIAGEGAFQCMYDMLFEDVEYPYHLMEPLTPLSSIGYEIQGK